MQKEIVIRISVEVPDEAKAPAQAVKPKKNYGKTVPQDFYSRMLALPVGGQMDITKETKELNATIVKMKNRIGSWFFWKNKKDNTDYHFTVVRGAGSEIKAIRTN